MKLVRIFCRAEIIGGRRKTVKDFARLRNEASGEDLAAGGVSASRPTAIR
jgi:hypothetical protein